MDNSYAIFAGFAVAAVGCLAVFLLARRLVLVKKLAFPLYVAAIAGGLKVATLGAAVSLSIVDRSLAWLLLLLPVVLVVRLVGILLFDVHLKERRGLRLPPLLPSVTVWAAYLVAALVTFKQVFPEVGIGPLLATSAVTSLVLGLALQPILGNFFSGVVLSLERPFDINDWVEVEGVEGRVSAITWRTTHLRTRENDNLIIPNSRIAESKVLNFAKPHKLHLLRVEVGAHYRTPPYRVREALIEAAVGAPNTLGRPSPEVHILDFADSAVLYELRVWIPDYARAPRISSDVRARIWEELKRRDITIPFPIRTLEIEPRRRSTPSEDGRPPARLFVAEGANAGTAAAIDTGSFALGRDPACDLVLADGQASKQHCRIEWADGAYRIVDSNSSYGTKVNEEAVRSRELGNFDRISIGASVIIFELDAP